MTADSSTYYNRFKWWSAEFQLADADRKRFIIALLYSCIEIGRNYELKFVLDANHQQFLDGKRDRPDRD